MDNKKATEASLGGSELAYVETTLRVWSSPGGLAKDRLIRRFTAICVHQSSKAIIIKPIANA